MESRHDFDVDVRQRARVAFDTMMLQEEGDSVSQLIVLGNGAEQLPGVPGTVEMVIVTSERLAAPLRLVYALLETAQSVVSAVDGAQ